MTRSLLTSTDYGTGKLAVAMGRLDGVGWQRFSRPKLYGDGIRSGACTEMGKEELNVTDLLD